MDDTLKKIIIYLVITIVIIGIIYVAYRLIMNTPLGKGLGKFLNGVGGVLAAAGAQLQTCNKSGYFNVSKGCWLGVAGVAIGALYGGAWLYGRFKTTSGNDTIDKTAQLAEENPVDVAGRITDGMDVEGINALDDNVVNQAAIQKMLIRKAATDYNDRVDSSGLSPQEVQQLRTMNQSDYNAAIAEANEGLTAEQQTDSDDVATQFVDEPVFA